MTNNPPIFAEWIEAKQQEIEAKERRLHLEQSMIEAFDIGDIEGTQNIEASGFKVKVTGRMNRKVDSEKLQEIAAENGLSEHLPSLFRWKPEINMSAWKAAQASITDPLREAITTTPGKPTFDIKEDDK